GSTPTGSAAFTFFPNGLCTTGTGSSAGGSAVSGNSGTSTAVSNKEGPLSVGSYSFNASYTSTNPNFKNVTSCCEPLKVVSSISAFSYMIKGIWNGSMWSSSNYGNPSGPWACHTDDSGSAPTAFFPPGLTSSVTSVPDPSTCGNWQKGTP